MNYTTTMPSAMGSDCQTAPVPTKEPREDSVAGMIREQSIMLFECKRIAEDILYVITNESYKDPPTEPENLMQNIHSNLGLTKTVIEELSTIKDLVCG